MLAGMTSPSPVPAPTTAPIPAPIPAPPALPYSAPAERNGAPILAVLQSLLPANARVLEIASGTGQHAQRFAAACPGWDWQPSDVTADRLAAIARRCAGVVNVRPALELDVLASDWPTAGPFDAVYCANMLHISPWETCASLMSGAAARLVPSGLLMVYGPFIVDGEPLAPGNLAFDADLRGRDPGWGLRRLAAVDEQARRAGLALAGRHDMPANNLLLAWRRNGGDAGDPPQGVTTLNRLQSVGKIDTAT